MTLAEVTTTPSREPPLKTVSGAGLDRLLRPLHRWVWSDARRRADKLLRFAETEADGGRDIARAAERTNDALLRRLYLRHAMDEQRHAKLFRTRGRDILAALSSASGAEGFQAQLALARRARASTISTSTTRRTTRSSRSCTCPRRPRRAGSPSTTRSWRSIPTTRDVFGDVLKDEAFHMNYTLAQLKRVSPKKHGLRLWWARLTRLWKGYLRIASALASVMGGVVLAVQYFVVLPVFALFAKRAAKRELPRLGRRARRGGDAELAVLRQAEE